MNLTDTQKRLLVGLSLLLLGIGIGRFTKPAKVETVIKTVETSTTKTEKSVDKIQKKDKVVTIKETKNADGTTTKETVITDKTVTDTNIDSKQTKDTKKESESSTTITRDIGLTVQALAVFDLNDLTQVNGGGVLIKKRIVGNISSSLIGIVEKSGEKRILFGAGLDF